MWFTAPELGHPLIDDNQHPLVNPFLHEYVSRFVGMNDDKD